ncbi:MAG: PTS sugar transporter subunit IIA [Deltaproteobacteria bacterium]
MIGAVIITHGRLAESLIESAETITGPVEFMRAVSIKKTDTTEAIRAGLVRSVFELDKGKGVIIFTDMFGGTPTNVALSLMTEGRVEVITGVNLPVIIKFINCRAEKSLQETALLLKDYGQKSIVLAAEFLKEKK